MLIPLARAVFELHAMAVNTILVNAHEFEGITLVFRR